MGMPLYKQKSTFMCYYMRQYKQLPREGAPSGMTSFTILISLIRLCLLHDSDFRFYAESCFVAP